MKRLIINKIFRFMTIGLILWIVFVTGCSKGISPKLTNTIKALKFENIKAARIELGRTGGDPIKNYSFDLNNSEHTKIIKDVINYLNSAKIKGNADEKINDKGTSPTFLILELKDVSVIYIKSAVGDKVTKLPDGSIEVAKLDISNQITISTSTKNNEKPVRIISPEIRKLIYSGYKDIFK